MNTPTHGTTRGSGHEHRVGPRLGLRFGTWVDDAGRTAQEMVAAARAAAAAGLDGFWLTESHHGDPLTLLALIGREVPEIGLGTAVVRTYPRHPLVLASQALTVQALTGNRLTLGLGTSHREIVEQEYGYDFERPGRFTEEYLSALMPLLHGEAVTYRGETLRATGQVTVPGAEPPRVLLAAHGRRLLRLGGELADGVLVTWVGPTVLARHIVPTVSQAASRAGRPAPRVLATALVSVSSDPVAKREWVARTYGAAGALPSYRETLEREGVGGPADVAIVGDENGVARALQRLADAGLTDLVAIPFGDPAEVGRTRALIKALTRTHAGDGSG